MPEKKQHGPWSHVPKPSQNETPDQCEDRGLCGRLDLESEEGTEKEHDGGTT